MLSFVSQTVGGDDYNSVCCATDLCNLSPASPLRPLVGAAIGWWAAALTATALAVFLPAITASI
jgi:hypothetical protein